VFALVTGSGFYDIPELVDRAVESVPNPFGDPVTVTTGRWRGADVCFVPRHGSDHSIPPHGINYRANISALATIGATSIVATAVSGAINPDMAPGSLVVISDFLNFTSGRDTTFFDGSRRPIVAGDPGAESEPAAELEQVRLLDGAVYCTTDGPRFETPAEINMMRVLGGDLVGMTGYPEVALAVEAGLPYASIGVVSNPAAGMNAEPLSIDDIVAIIDTTAEPLYRLIGRTIELQAAAAENGAQ
ncbi:UNVERIFIED_CONTAM: hypothetical protein GTU68_049822, partial [Idotea baltica]|nr:hypothetical protein [Idotea baltica]